MQARHVKQPAEVRESGQWSAAVLGVPTGGPDGCGCRLLETGEICALTPASKGVNINGQPNMTP